MSKLRKVTFLLSIVLAVPPQSTDQPSRPKPVLCKFVSRKTRDAVIKQRKLLKDKKDKIFLNDDLTLLRAKLFRYAKNLPNVKRANTNNGKIHCTTNADVHIIIDTPDDLFKLGVESIDYSRLGIQDYVI